MFFLVNCVKRVILFSVSPIIYSVSFRGAQFSNFFNRGTGNWMRIAQRYDTLWQCVGQCNLQCGIVPCCCNSDCDYNLENMYNRSQKRKLCNQKETICPIDHNLLFLCWYYWCGFILPNIFTANLIQCQWRYWWIQV